MAATFSRDLAYARGEAMGIEHRGKGVDVQLGPVCGPLGRAPEGGRNWVCLITVLLFILTDILHRKGSVLTHI